MIILAVILSLFILGVLHAFSGGSIEPPPISKNGQTISEVLFSFMRNRQSLSIFLSNRVIDFWLVWAMYQYLHFSTLTFCIIMLTTPFFRHIGFNLIKDAD